MKKDVIFDCFCLVFTVVVPAASLVFIVVVFADVVVCAASSDVAVDVFVVEMAFRLSFSSLSRQLSIFLHHDELFLTTILLVAETL